MKRTWLALIGALVITASGATAVFAGNGNGSAVSWCIANHRAYGDTSVGEAQSSTAHSDDGHPGNGDMYRRGSPHRTDNCFEESR